ncbi:MAG: hypothetical protein GQ552_05070 [Flavobacteriaceae bacterium]|nr:hypothetical protein [Flavobacteriaceae bacterium]
MNILTTSLLLLLSIAFSIIQPQTKTQNPIKKNYAPETFDKFTVNHEDYTLSISIESADNQPVLVISMDLKNNAYFISPLEEKDFTGKFYFDFGSYKDLAFEGEVSESPRSVAKLLYPNYTNNEENLWITENTTYKQSLKFKTIHDFEVYGRIQFTIEPRCTFEEIPFRILYKDGKFTFLDAKC